jgi:hypothetical protein
MWVVNDARDLIAIGDQALSVHGQDADMARVFLGADRACLQVEVVVLERAEGGRLCSVLSTCGSSC